MIRAALFDLDGVLRQFDPGHPARVEAESGLPAGTLHRVAFDAVRIATALDGRVAFDDWRDAVATALEQDHDVADGRTVADRFFAVEAGAVDHEVLALVRGVRRHVRVGLLTNATSRLADELEVLRLGDEVDVVCNSWEMGVAKPDARAFTLAAERLGVTAGDCFFTDDRPENVAAARAVGMSAHHFDGVDGLRNALASFLER